MAWSSLKHGCRGKPTLQQIIEDQEILERHICQDLKAMGMTREEAQHLTEMNGVEDWP